MAAIVLHDDGTLCSERGPDRRCGRKHRVFPDSSRPESKTSAQLEELIEAVYGLTDQFGALASSIEQQARAIEAQPAKTIEREVVRFVEVEKPSEPEPKAPEPTALPVEAAETPGFWARIWKA